MVCTLGTKVSFWDRCGTSLNIMYGKNQDETGKKRPSVGVFPRETGMASES